MTHLPDDNNGLVVYGNILRFGSFVLVSRVKKIPQCYHRQEYFLYDENLKELDYKMVEIDFGIDFTYKRRRTGFCEPNIC